MNHDSVFASRYSQEKWPLNTERFCWRSFETPENDNPTKRKQPTFSLAEGKKETENIPFLQQGNKTMVMVLICSLIILIFILLIAWQLFAQAN